MESTDLTPLQWQIMMKCWKLNVQRALQSRWGPVAWRLGSLFLWMWKLRKMNGPNFTWPLLLFSGALPEWLMARMGKIYRCRPLAIKNRNELLATLKPQHWKHLRADNGDLPDGWGSPPDFREPAPLLRVLSAAGRNR